jgi:hypothetical protein
MRARRAARIGFAVVAALAAAQIGVLLAQTAGGGEDDAAGAAVAAVPALLRSTTDTERTVGAYDGLGAWVDLFDLADGTVGPDAVDAMADAGVRTLYLQAARESTDGAPSPPGVSDPALLGRFLVRAHERGLRVVGWYVPRFGDVDRDLAHLQAISSFDVLGHRFDGVAVDIEWRESVTDPAERSARLVELSERFRADVGDQAVGAIVMPPVQLEVVNPGFWPGFPWRDLAPLYDAWLPMNYWTERTASSGYRDPTRYTVENLDRLRADVGDDAPIHVIGGLGADLGAGDIDAFATAVDDHGAVGASVYDWATLPPDARNLLADAIGG